MQLTAEVAELQEKVNHLQKEKQLLADRLCQARYQAKSEIMSYKQKCEELEQKLKVRVVHDTVILCNS